jgi:type VI protein secretion system component VasK
MNAPGGPQRQIEAQLRSALQAIRAAPGRSKTAGRLPWYVLMGPAKAGKTAALRSAGLTAAPDGEGEAEPPPGGAAEVWLADQGVVLATGGDYLAGAGEAGWRQLVLQVQRQVGRQLSGVILMLALDDLVQAGADGRRLTARSLRARAAELQRAARLRLPVYLIITKADRLAGFTAFFEQQRPTARAQVWGVTLPVPEGEAVAGDLAAGLEALVLRLDEQLLERLQGEADPARQQLIFAFPHQLAMLSSMLRDMLEELALGTQREPGLRLRGLYFTSAEQSGPNVDLAARATGHQFGLELPPVSEPRVGGGFFLQRLFGEVIFREANLATFDARYRPGEQRLRLLAVAASLVIALGLGVLWGLSYVDQQRRLAATEARLAADVALARTIPTRDVVDADFARAARVADQARDLSADFATSWGGVLTLDQSAKVDAGQRDLYTRTLDLVLLPRILFRLQEDVRPRAGARDAADVDRLYLMLAKALPLDIDFVGKALAAKFEHLLPGKEHEDLRRSLAAHTAALLAKPLPDIGLSEDVLAETLARVTRAAARK